MRKVIYLSCRTSVRIKKCLEDLRIVTSFVSLTRNNAVHMYMIIRFSSVQPDNSDSFGCDKNYYGFPNARIGTLTRIYSLRLNKQFSVGHPTVSNQKDSR